MQHQFFYVLCALSAAGLCSADIPQAEQALHNGAPAEALRALKDVAESPEQHYLKGRALTALRRYDQAIQEFAAIETQHPLYAYAAKGIIYCARRCATPAQQLEQLTQSPNADIALQARIALAEIHVSGGEDSPLAELNTACANHADLKGGILLLEAEQLRRAGKYDAAMAKCREAEDKAPAFQREYSRILLAEIYYDKEKAEGDDEGKGEETLLKFISSSPDSALLEEAFRRLDKRGAFSTSKYAIRKLEEWSRDGAAMRRALLASAIVQREALQTARNEELGDIAANRATGINPEYLPITVQINNEQSRYLIINGKKEEAAAYLNRIPEAKRDAFSLFYKARTLPATDPIALELYLKSADCAYPELQEIALSNAVYCAHVTENAAILADILQRELPTAVSRAIKLTHAGLNLRKDPQTARAALQQVLQMQPTPAQKVEATLQLTQLDLDEGDSISALKRLEEYTHKDRHDWTNEQVMRYYGLYLHALESEQEVGRATASHKPFLEKSLKSTQREDVRVAITLKLAKIYSEEGNHRDALLLLEDLAAKTKDRTMRARALLLAGRESTQCLTLPSVTKGAELFEAAAAIDSPYHFRAAILNTAVRFRISDEKDANQRINRIIREIETARKATPGSTHLAEEYAFALTVRADIEAIPGTPEALKTAIETNAQVFTIPGLTEEWHRRAYLQQAIFCTRVDYNERALLSYKNIINSLPATTKQATPDKAYILCLSGTGAIACLLKMEQWEAAADMAETVVRHPISQAYPERTEHFKAWARQIRKVHFLPMKESE